MQARRPSTNPGPPRESRVVTQSQTWRLAKGRRSLLAKPPWETQVGAASFAPILKAGWETQVPLCQANVGFPLQGTPWNKVSPRPRKPLITCELARRLQSYPIKDYAKNTNFVLTKVPILETENDAGKTLIWLNKMCYFMFIFINIVDHHF